LVRLFFCEANEDFLAHVDSGSGLTLIVTYEFALAHKLIPKNRTEFVELASGQLAPFLEYEARVWWSGAEQTVAAYVPADSDGKPRRASKKQLLDTDRPEVTIGSPLLDGKIVTLNYATNVVTIAMA